MQHRLRHSGSLGNRIGSGIGGGGGGSTPDIPADIVTATIEEATPTQVFINFAWNLDETSIPDTSAFTLAGKTITLVSVSGAQVVLTVSVTYDYGDSVTVDYTLDESNPLKDADGARIESFSGQVVTNYITYPFILNDGNTKFWYDPSALTTITKDGSNLVSRWNDKLLSGRDLLQADADMQPLWTANTILFDGIDNAMKTDAFTFTQPEFIYMIVKVVTWTLNNRIFDGNANNSGVLYEASTTPGVKGYAGVNSAQDDNLTVGIWHVVRVLFNGASSKIIIDNNTPTTWNCGANNMGAFTLAKIGTGLNYANIQVKDVIGRISVLGETDIYNWLTTRL